MRKKKKHLPRCINALVTDWIPIKATPGKRQVSPPRIFILNNIRLKSSSVLHGSVLHGAVLHGAVLHCAVRRWA